MSGPFPPSARRLAEARARGEVAHSPALTAAAALFGGTLATAATARSAAARITLLARQAWAGHGDAVAIVPALTAIVLPVALAAFAAALVAGVAQTRGLVAFGALGRRRRADDDALPLVGIAASLTLAIVLLAPLAFVIRSGARASDLPSLLSVALASLGMLAPRALILLALAGLADFAWRRQRLTAALSMSRAEREAERRQDEGDPRLRAEQRRRQRALTRDPLVDDVSRAEVVLLAEGLAVGLREVDGAARVAASLASAGEDDRLRAQRLVAVARRLKRPIRVDDGLAEAAAHLPAGALVPDAWQSRALALIRASRRA
jgi:flagellar biosynthesis protein FlhB